MSNRRLKTLLISGLIFCLSSSAFAYSGGTGEPNDPYQIGTISDWQELMGTDTDWNKHFVLVNYIDLQGVTVTPVGISYGNSFTGVLDGQDYIISNPTIIADAQDKVGLFGFIGPNGIITNLGIEDANISGQLDVGGLVGSNWNSTITNCYVTGTVNGNVFVGGLAGGNNTGSIITNCYTTGIVTGNQQGIGGLTGSNNRSIITDSYSTSITGINDSGSQIGGLVGFSYEGAIINCYATGAVAGRYSVGGLAGNNSTGSNMIDCYATGVVTGRTSIGGLVGENHHTINRSYATGMVTGSYMMIGGLVGGSDDTITDCYATGVVNGGDSVGGLVGYDEFGGIINCYSTGTVNGNDFIGGLVGDCFDQNDVNASFWDIETSGQTHSDGGEGKTTEQMQDMATFTSAGWDFVSETANGDEDIWRMCVDDIHYPEFYWQYLPADLVCPDGVSFEDLGVFAQWWLETDCSSLNNDCGRTDMKIDGTVNFLDFAIMASHWLEDN